MEMKTRAKQKFKGWSALDHVCITSLFSDTQLASLVCHRRTLVRLLTMQAICITLTPVYRAITERLIPRQLRGTALS